MTHLFGTDGIRGIANLELNIELVSKIGKALSLFNIKKVVIGQDTRISSPMISFCLTSSLLAMGINVYDEGVISTPCLSLISEKLNAIGVMITASHNPFYYNGIKIFINGKKLTKEQEKFIEENINKEYSYNNDIGKYEQSNFKEKYLKKLNKHINKYNLRIGIDCANGATYLLARDIFHKITNSIYLFNNLPNGYNINDLVGSTHIETLQSYVNKYKLDIGFSYDGDGDRLICVSKQGRVINGNNIIIILARYLFDYLGYPNRSVVLTKDSNLGIIKHLESLNIKVFLSDIGDSNVRALMDKENIVLGGEDSGHIITPYSIYGDGILTSLILLNALHHMNKGLDDLIENIKLYPFLKYNIDKYNKEILKNELVIDLIKEIKYIFGNDGVILIRASGTEDLIRVYLCHKEQEKLDKYNKLLLKCFDKVGKYYER